MTIPIPFQYPTIYHTPSQYPTINFIGVCLNIDCNCDLSYLRLLTLGRSTKYFILLCVGVQYERSTLVSNLAFQRILFPRDIRNTRNRIYEIKSLIFEIFSQQTLVTPATTHAASLSQSKFFM